MGRKVCYQGCSLIKIPHPFPCCQSLSAPTQSPAVTLSHAHYHRDHFEVCREMEHERKEHKGCTDRCVCVAHGYTVYPAFFPPVLKHVLCRYPPEVLMKFDGIQQTVEGLVPYTERHFQRLSRLQQVGGAHEGGGRGR